MSQDPLLELVTRRGWISPEQARRVTEAMAAAERAGRKADPSQHLISLGFLTPDQVTRARRELSGGGLAIPGIKIIRRLGAGGFGAVYLGEQTDLGRKVAVKVMDPKLATNREYVQRFLGEVRAVARLDHENLVNAMTAGEAGGRYYLVMEYIEGAPLNELIAQLPSDL